jgi:hypothetical protein
MPAPTGGPGARRAAHAKAGAALAALDDRRLADVLSAATPLGSGVGGRAAELEADGVRVFVKRVPLTDLELRPEHVRSTANLFGLPLFYQYGIGSVGFGAWRELAAHLITTGWVLRGEHAGFPLLHHWRVLPDRPPTGFADAFGGIDGAVAHWDGSRAVRRRLEAVGRSSASLVLFLEHVPYTLADWLSDRHPPDGSPPPWLERRLADVTAFMSSRGLVHFDAHFRNLLTDGQQVYVADFGLAAHTSFALSPAEAAFLTDHLLYDRCYVPAHLLRHHLLVPLGDDGRRRAFLRAWLAGSRPGGVPPAVAALLDRHARPTLVLDAFFQALLTRDKRTPFPAAELRAAMSPQ